MDAAIAPVIDMKLPWVAVVGNHDQEDKVYMNYYPRQNEPAPGMAFFHIPLPEFSSFTSNNFTGVKQEEISSPSINSGFFYTMLEAGDVKAAFVGHDHINDFCGKLNGIHLCYAGGSGYHAYGKAGWS
ncbi:putative inactive purple acid phosphatase 29 [Dichanthelium oligosanthes]|uniref:Putative inactive purple acid phosphatase 29 n=1 Tax=Dichanthelium oligosanthes TaxID=888268 RepID=A0A1E5V487_9POAL|nr:putative inactive purple acid phosphatase 29 [Dichanthelium oligosanthes]